jgi:hypothetical protein
LFGEADDDDFLSSFAKKNSEEEQRKKQQEARKVRQVENLGSYNCRNRNS